MALRCLLRRFPVRSPSGPLMGPVRGVSPATGGGARRFLTTEEEKYLPEDILQQLKRSRERFAIIKANNEQAMKMHIEVEAVQAKMEDVRRQVEIMDRCGTFLRILGYVTTVALVVASFRL